MQSVRTPTVTAIVFHVKLIFLVRRLQFRIFLMNIYRGEELTEQRLSFLERKVNVMELVNLFQSVFLILILLLK